MLNDKKQNLIPIIGQKILKSIHRNLNDIKTYGKIFSFIRNKEMKSSENFFLT
jgi:hypothetical protein